MSAAAFMAFNSHAAHGADSNYLEDDPDEDLGGLDAAIERMLATRTGTEGVPGDKISMEPPAGPDDDAPALADGKDGTPAPDVVPDLAEGSDAPEPSPGGGGLSRTNTIFQPTPSDPGSETELVSQIVAENLERKVSAPTTAQTTKVLPEVEMSPFDVILNTLGLITPDPTPQTPAARRQPEPQAEPTPGSIPAPVVAPVPVVDPEPVVTPAPVVAPDPVVDPEPVVTPDPVVDPEPVVDPDPVVAPDPVVDPVPDPDPTPGDDVSDEDAPGEDDPGEDTPDADIVDTAQPAVSGMTVAAGRVTTIEPNLGAVVSIKILDKPGIGNLTVNPDNTLALVLTGTDYDGPLSFSYEATFADGTTQTVDLGVTVDPLQQLQGWATGDSAYMLETDEDGQLIVEHGDNHHKIHVSGAEDALSRADIARLEGISESAVTGRTLVDNGYGTTPGTALDEDMGLLAWSMETIWASEPGSHWLMFERGHDYGFSGLIPKGVSGESQLNPYYIGAYGDGAAPAMTSQLRVLGEPSSNFVIEGLEFTEGLRLLDSSNLLFNDIIVDGAKVVVMGVADRIEGITIRNSTIHDAVASAPLGDVWGTGDRVSGLFVRTVDGLLIEGLHVDKIGWEDGYSFDGNPNFGQTPVNQSQNIYIQHGVDDITFRDNISMQAASFGAQVRPGGFIEDNVFIDNNGALNALGGEYVDANTRTGHFSLITDNLVTSAGARASYLEGALSWGIDPLGLNSTLLDNIVAHLSDPNNAAEFAAKTGNGSAVVDRGPDYFDDTIVYNWLAKNFPGNGTVLARNADRNTEGLDTDVLNQTTIQAFTAALLGQPGSTIGDLGLYLRAQVADGAVNQTTADDIIDYFQDAFGIAPDTRDTAEVLRFVPDDLGDGVRWDSRINWSTDDLPGTIEGDSVDLGGNWVTFATITATIDDLDMGSDGRLLVASGRLSVEGDLAAGADGAEIDVVNAGQLFLNGYAGGVSVDIDIAGGRFANTGEMNGPVDITVTGGQAILAIGEASMVLSDGSSLTIAGDDTDIGFDGTNGDIATLHVETGGRINFVATANGFSGIGEFRSGHFGEETSNVTSGIDLGGGTLGIDVTALTTGQAFQDVLFRADEIVGNFDDIEIIGLGNNRDATILFDYETDEMIFNLSATGTGTGAMSVQVQGNMVENTASSTALWAALTDGQGTYENTALPRIFESEDPTFLTI